MLVFGGLLLGFQTLVLLLSVIFLLLWARKKWDESAEKKNEIRRLVETVTREAELVENDAIREYGYLSRAFTMPRGQLHDQHHQLHQHRFRESGLKQEQLRRGKCAVCFSLTTTRCAGCKSVHYCSGKCQIIHWRGGHKEECRFIANVIDDCDFGSADGKRKSEIHIGKGIMPDGSLANELWVHSTGDGAPPLSDNSQLSMEGRLFHEKFGKAVRKRGVSASVKGRKMETSDLVSNGSSCDEVLTYYDSQVSNRSGKKSINILSSDQLFEDLSMDTKSTLDLRLASVGSGKLLFKGKGSETFSYDVCTEHPQDAFKVSKPSLLGKVKHFKVPKIAFKQKMIFPYEVFVELYSYCDELHPFGLINCGNSCYANAVLQCLAFTRPLTAYLMRGLHSAECKMKEWCFVCELEILILKGRGGESPLSPFKILSKVETFGSHIGRGTEEDAHEFLRYAVDTMQSIFLREAGALGSPVEETTLIGLTFGGCLRSKITCLRCNWESEKLERIMDLIVEVNGNIQTLDDAFKQFTMEELLDGANKYHCNRCQCYVKARKDLSIVEAPNILTVVLKRFQHGNLQKLYKAVRFPEVFDIAPYIRGNRDRSPHYSLYAVVVHQSNRNDTSTGHYLCYVKNAGGVWFGINDSSVISVEPEKVLLEEAYMLLYARHCPRSPPLLSKDSTFSSSGLRRNNMQATSSPTGPNVLGLNQVKTQQKHLTNNCLSAPKGIPSSRLHDWRFYRVPRGTPVDASSESSSIFSSSDASTCSSTGTKDSDRSEEQPDFISRGSSTDFGFDRCGPYSHHIDSESLRKRDTWRPQVTATER